MPNPTQTFQPEGGVTSPAGFSAAAVACGVKQSGRPDLALIVSDRPCAAAGVFTRNQVAAAPVILDRAALAANNAAVHGVVVNAGNANACTGEQGLINAREMQRLAAEAAGCRPDQFLVMSTGVIGVQLPMDKIANGIGRAAAALATDGGRAAAEAIMTTDTRPKHGTVVVELSGGRVAIGGMAKGAGMIHPNMATLLALLTTDAILEPSAASRHLAEATATSFNAISVDGDTSTNDTALLLANGASGVALSSAGDEDAFGAALGELCLRLAHMIVRDGEGATRFVEIAVSGARETAEARQIAAAIATSPLVKTAFAGGDPNWGRILAAAGRAGVALDQNCLSLWIGDEETEMLQIVRQGGPTGYREAEAAAIFARPSIRVRLDLGLGAAAAVMWTTDLSHEYVSINADYRT